MNKPKVSVIVPVYNVEKHLKECVDSIIHQTLKDIEIIFINDGSPDNCENILNQYEKDDSRITIVCQENQGVSIARNNGLKKAAGKYRYIMDSDDFLDKEALEQMYNKLEHDNSDLVLIDWYEYFDKDNKKQVRNNTALGEKRDFYPYSVWGFMFSNSLLKQHPDIAFPEKAHPVEDTTFAFMIFCVAEKFSYINKPLLYYRQHTNMVMEQIKGSKAEQYIQSNIICLNELKQFWANNSKTISKHKFKYISLHNRCLFLVKHITGKKIKIAMPKELLIAQKILYPLSRVLYQKKTTRSNKIIVKILKIPVYVKKCN